MSDSNNQAAYAELFADIFYEQFISAYYVNLLDYTYVVYYRRKGLEKKYGNGENAVKAIKKFISEDVHPDDREQLKNISSAEYIRERLKKESSFSYVVREVVTGKERYCKIQVTRGRDEDHIAFCFLNVDDEIRKRMKIDESNRIIQALAAEYSVLYRIELDTEKMLSYIKSKTESGFEKKIRRDTKYSDALERYCKEIVCEEDAKRLLSMASIENIRKMLSIVRHFEINYRQKNGRYFEMKFVRISDENTSTVVLGVADCDEEMRTGVINREFSEIANALSVEYEIIYYVNLKDESYDVFNQEDSYIKLKLLLSGQNFFDECARDIKKIIYPQDVERLSSVMRKDYLLSQLARDKSFSVEYRLIVDGEPQYYRLKVLWSKAADDHIIIAVANVNKEVVAREEHKRDMERNFDIIKVLATEYSSVYYIDLETDSLTPYTMNANTESKFGTIFSSGIHYSDAFKMYVDSIVYELDKKMVLEAGSIERIKAQLALQKSFITQYRSYESGVARFCEMKFVKVGPENGKPRAVVLGFADKDAEILNRYVDSRLYEDYFGVYFVNLEDDTIRGVRESTIYEKGSTYGGYRKYSSAVLEFSKAVLPEFRETWVNMANVEFMRSYLANDDKREYNYRALKGEWRRATTFVIERKNGIPTSFILAFMFIDNVTAQKMELDAKIAEQKIALEQQQVLLEKALVQAESANKAKTMFLSNMSHDIRTPMNAIIGFTNLALNNLDDPSTVKNYLDKTVVSSTHLLSLINDILDMSRIESGKIRLEEVNCSLSEIMHDLNTIVLGQARVKQQNLYTDSFDIENEYVICDKLRLHQMLINLLSNAVKFTPAGGNIHVFVRQIGKDEKTASYEFHVKDDGIGMSPEFLKVLYEPFERERTSTLSKTQGTGLGMSITKKIVDMMGGTIDVVSAPGKGTEYTVRLKLKIQDSTVDFSMLESLQNARALVVDRDYNACSSATNLLRRLGLRSEWTMYGKEAVLRVKESVERHEHFAVIFIDDSMMDLESVEMVRQIRSISNSENPIIIMTSYDWTNIENAARDAGVTDFMSKPLFFTEMHNVLARAIGVMKDDPQKVDEKGVDFSGKKILLVEDNELNREIAESVLEEMGFAVDYAEDGSVALEMLCAEKPNVYDLILMDVQMPVMDGLETARRIRALHHEYFKNVPIVAMTANAFEEDRKAALDAGMNEHIAKPINVDKLKEVLRKFLN
ncbi:response regulator [Fibrobacter sp. UWB12]|uniref:response regulator n=1 Tax=Fibrobacter sp. UWB12 TaxID=1896203 RepID=UPI0009110080|nr:response regulator [Fibrobacter sp. UWB12]SHK49756.1 Signal transduction histidine kinase [Fibrobacter sp. UWB12]